MYCVTNCHCSVDTPDLDSIKLLLSLMAVLKCHVVVIKWSGNLWLVDHVYILYISYLLLCVLFLIVHILIQLGVCIHDCVLCILCIYTSACVCACFCVYWCVHACMGGCAGMWTVLCSLSEILASTSPHAEGRHAKKHRLSWWCVVVWVTRSNGNNCVHNVTLSITVVCTCISTPHFVVYHT